jgi:hypothetical protein
VYLLGISAPSAKAEERTLSAMVFSDQAACSYRTNMTFKLMFGGGTWDRVFILAVCSGKTPRTFAFDMRIR